MKSVKKIHKVITNICYVECRQYDKSNGRRHHLVLLVLSKPDIYNTVIIIHIIIQLLNYSRKSRSISSTVIRHSQVAPHSFIYFIFCFVFLDIFSTVHKSISFQSNKTIEFVQFQYAYR